VASLPPESRSKIRIVQSIGELVQQSNVIFSCVADDAAISSTYETALRDGGDVKGKLFVDCSTVHPDTTTKLEEMVTTKGANLVASPGALRLAVLATACLMSHPFSIRCPRRG
jgi:3-hydroxyisobutyrate dehydrogenase-like beta-hydroxyacid dehydrogenase